MAHESAFYRTIPSLDFQYIVLVEDQVFVSHLPSNDYPTMECFVDSDSDSDYDHPFDIKGNVVAFKNRIVPLSKDSKYEDVIDIVDMTHNDFAFLLDIFPQLDFHQYPGKRHWVSLKPKTRCSHDPHDEGVFYETLSGL
ncbi:hypothetical protein ONZ45_g18780 [Pleurotus djamor]|nr:hypothetical protein ONZ45_g18780 [Pleurotus djamor]